MMSVGVRYFTPGRNVADPRSTPNNCPPTTGAGKSSFLDCVSLRNQQFNGSVFVNGKPADESYYFMTGACACAWIEIELVVD